MMHNIIFGKDGKIWLVGWDRSGFYPRWFEYLSTVSIATDAPDSWNRFIPLIADPFFKVPDVDGPTWGCFGSVCLTNSTNTMVYLHGSIRSLIKFPCAFRNLPLSSGMR
jgi:hypothetical protein